MKANIPRICAHHNILSYTTSHSVLKPFKNGTTNQELIGNDSDGFKPAVAVIDGDHLTLTSEGVNAPVAFRFAWHKLAEPNLTGGTGLPVGAVRGGEAPSK